MRRYVYHQDRPHQTAVPRAHHSTARSPRRQHLVVHLHQAGPRPTLEALLEVAAGAPLDQVLEIYGRIPISTYRALGASDLAIDEVTIVDGGRR